MPSKIKKVFQSRIFRKWFYILFSMITLLFFCFSYFTYSNSKKMLQEEALSYNRLQTEQIANYIDETIMDLRLIMATIVLNSNTVIYMHNENAYRVAPDLNTRLHYQLFSYKNSFSVLDSIYLYSFANNSILTNESVQACSLNSFTDTNWLDQIEAAEDKPYLLFTRRKNNRYPYLLCLLKAVKAGDSENSAVILNINLSKMSLLTEDSQKKQSVYIVSDGGEILYRSGQTDIPEPLESVPELCDFTTGQTSAVHMFVNGHAPHIYGQIHSRDYPWYYVTVADIEEYSARLTDATTIFINNLIWLFLIAFIVVLTFVIMSTSPLRFISEYLKMPETKNLANINDAQTKEIVQNIFTYIQANRSLSDELNRQIELQNKATLCALQSQINPHFLFNTLNMIRASEIETLGYDHEAPTLTLSLSRLLQYALKSSEMVELDTELFYTEQYLQIINKRYQNQLRIEILPDPRMGSVRVPKLIIQPLIENAIFHGCLSEIETRNHIIITTELTDRQCLLTVSDNGIGISPDKLNQLLEDLRNIEESSTDHIGLHNVALRMHLLFGAQFHIKIESKEKVGTKISLLFPYVL